jgi:hypothetical protein
VFPRVIAVIAVMTCTFVLLRTKEWVWVERLLLALLVAAIIALISVALDAEFFPRSLFRNGARSIGLALWTRYFLFLSGCAAFFSQTHDWQAERQITTVTGS